MMRIAVRPVVRPSTALASNKVSTRASRFTTRPTASADGPTARILGGVSALRRRVVAAASNRLVVTHDTSPQTTGGDGGGSGGAPPKKKTGDHGEHGDPFFKFGEFFISVFNRFAAVLLVYKGLQAMYFSLLYACKDGCGCVGNGLYYNQARIVLGRGVLISLEFLLISDVLETMLFGANLDRMIVIGITATIRTMIDYFTSKEIEEAEEALEKLKEGHSHSHGKHGK
eukprot:786110-Prorocentrum_minimum.AAC.1